MPSWNSLPASVRRELVSYGISRERYESVPEHARGQLIGKSRQIARRAAQRRTAKQVREGTYQPSPIGAKARQAANKLKITSGIDERDRDYVARFVARGWWDNGESLGEYRRSGTAESVWNYANDLVDHGVPSNVINITPYVIPGQPVRRFNIYATRRTG